jgi:hypothetical protein
MHLVDPPPHLVLRISVHFHLLRPLHTPTPSPSPLHEKKLNHGPPKPLAQKKRTQISSPTL